MEIKIKRQGYIARAYQQLLTGQACTNTTRDTMGRHLMVLIWAIFWIFQERFVVKSICFIKRNMEFRQFKETIQWMKNELR